MLMLSLLVNFAALQVVLAQGCTDVPPNNQYTCKQQKDWGKCSASWMKGYCSKTCGQCDQTTTPKDFECGQEGACVFGSGICNDVRCADSDCNAFQGNIQGEVIVLSVNSESYNAGPNHPPEVTNPAGCCDQCKATKNCNAWVFCGNENGCGSGCDNNAGFGPFGGCNGDKYPWLMCSLKTVSDVNNPNDAGAEDGFVSGVLLPQQ